MARAKIADGITAVLDKPYGRMLTCLHCGHAWQTQTQGYDPAICPRCKRPWNIPPHLIPKRVRTKKTRR